jgi:sugar phosphate permease
MKTFSLRKIYYGYYIVAACFIILYMLWGMVLNTFPVFLKPMTESMGWSRGDIPIAILIGAVGMTLSAPIAGKAIDRFGARPVMAIGAFIVGVNLMAGSLIQHLWQLYIVFGLIGCGLICSSVIPCSFLISNWFISRRGRAMGIAFAGTSLGGMVMSPVANWIIINYGWQRAFVFSGISTLVVVIPVILLLVRTRPSEMGLEPYKNSSTNTTGEDDNWGVGVKEAFSHKVFWQIALVMLLIGVVTSGIGNHSVAYFTDVGHTSTLATRAWSVVMGVMVLGKLAFGPVADRWGAKNAMAIASILLIASILILPFAQAYSFVMVFAVIYGFACGAPLVINPLLTAGGLGMKNFGAIFGILNMIASLGGSAGPIGAGYYFEAYKTYRPVFYLFAFLMAIAAFTAFLINKGAAVNIATRTDS